MTVSEDLHGCHTCGAPILWCVTDRGKRIAIDLAPSPEGDYMKLRLDRNGDKVVCYVPQVERPWVDFKLYTCHFSTCPNAKKNRDRSAPKDSAAA